MPKVHVVLLMFLRMFNTHTDLVHHPGILLSCESTRKDGMMFLSSANALCHLAFNDQWIFSAHSLLMPFAWRFEGQLCASSGLPNVRYVSKRKMNWQKLAPWRRSLQLFWSTASTCLTSTVTGRRCGRCRRQLWMKWQTS